MRRKDDEKQKAIKKAVVNVVLDQGMHGASISKIAKAAGVSPATVYIYYENKDVMLRDIYHEYAEELFGTLASKLPDNLTASDFIDQLIREYYQYMVSHEEIYHFVEQFSSCPSLHQGCSALGGPELLDGRIRQYKADGVLGDYDNSNIWALLFYPVKGIVKKSCEASMTPDQRLDEMIALVQKALLRQ